MRTAVKVGAKKKAPNVNRREGGETLFLVLSSKKTAGRGKRPHTYNNEEHRGSSGSPWGKGFAEFNWGRGGRVHLRMFTCRRGDRDRGFGRVQGRAVRLHKKEKKALENNKIDYAKKKMYNNVWVGGINKVIKK